MYVHIYVCMYACVISFCKDLQTCLFAVVVRKSGFRGMKKKVFIFSSQLLNAWILQACNFSVLKFEECNGRAFVSFATLASRRLN
jgi:hypothetical protein